MKKSIIDSFDLWTTAQSVKSNGRGRNANNQNLHGVNKLRELILGMAVRGMFESAHEIHSEKLENHISHARKTYYQSIGKKPKDYKFGPPPLNEFSIPKGWKWKRVGELCDLQTGATPSTQKPEYFKGDIRWLVSGDINQGIIEDCEGRITEAGLINSNCKILPPNSVLIALNGQGKTRATVALLNVHAACNQSLVGMIPYDTEILNPSYLFLSLKYRYFEIREITGQNQRRGLNMGLVSELSISLPPINEQNRIVARVNELLAICDQLEEQQNACNAAHETVVESLLQTLQNISVDFELEEAWQCIEENFDSLFTTEYSIDRFKETILQLAIMGKLVPQDPNDEPAIELLRKIAREKAKLVMKGNIRKQETMQVFEEDEMLYEIPKSWVWARPEDFSVKITDGEHFRPSTQQTGVYFLSAKDIRSEGVSLEEPLFVSNKIAEKALQRCNPEKGDLLIVSRGATVGRICLVDIDEVFCLLGSVILIKPMRPIVSEYLKIVMNASFIAEQLISASGSTAQPAIYLRDLKKIVFPIAPLAEQRRIVAKVDELFSLCDSIKKRISDSQMLKILLADTVVQHAVT